MMKEEDAKEGQAYTRGLESYWLPLKTDADKSRDNETPHRLRWQWGVVFREELEALVREGEGWVSGELSLLALEVFGGDGAGEAFGEGDFVA